MTTYASEYTDAEIDELLVAYNVTDPQAFSFTDEDAPELFEGETDKLLDFDEAPGMGRSR